MTRIRRWATTTAAVLVAALGLGHTASASTTAWANDPFRLCYEHGTVCQTYVEGLVTWSQRQARIGGVVVNKLFKGEFATAYFESFAGSTKVDGTTRTSHEDYEDFAFYMGDPNRVGGINRIKILLCRHKGTTTIDCLGPYNVWRD